MSDYNKIVNFDGKDDLPQNDPNKVIKGSEFDLEFSAVQSALSTKLDVVPQYEAIDTVTVTRGNSVGSDNTQLDTALQSNVFIDNFELLIAECEFTLLNNTNRIIISVSYDAEMVHSQIGGGTSSSGSSIKIELTNIETGATSNIPVNRFSGSQPIKSSLEIVFPKSTNEYTLDVFQRDIHIVEVRSSNTVENLVGSSNAGYRVTAELFDFQLSGSNAKYTNVIPSSIVVKEVNT